MAEDLISDIVFNFIELPKFNKSEGVFQTIIDQWVYFMKNAEIPEVIPGNIQVEGF